MPKPIHIEVKRGTTLQSGEYFSVNEVVPDGITYAQLLAGIADDTYTLRSLVNKTFKGQIRDRANAALKADLVFTVVDDKMKFSVPASVTETWPNNTATFFYDAIETDTVTGLVKVVAEGTIGVIPTITLE